MLFSTNALLLQEYADLRWCLLNKLVAAALLVPW
jgi:hypothetical protein